MICACTLHKKIISVSDEILDKQDYYVIEIKLEA